MITTTRSWLVNLNGIRNEQNKFVDSGHSSIVSVVEGLAEIERNCSTACINSSTTCRYVDVVDTFGSWLNSDSIHLHALSSVVLGECDV